MKNVHRQRGACMIYFDILLVAIACITMPFIVAVMLDIFYAERKSTLFITSYFSMVYRYVCIILYTIRITCYTKRIIYSNT